MNKKTIIPVAAIGLVVVSLVVYLVTRPAAPPVTKKTIQITQAPENEIIPTVGPEVKVDLKSVTSKQIISLVVDGVPANTTAIEYELTYSTKEKDADGAFSTAKPKAPETTFGKTFERQITLGTCSRNVCRYNVVTSDIKVSVKFEGAYGSQLFQKDYKMDNL
ncbi:MAG: hypothetical protein WCO78_00740 [Candidatus Roizmanbacteria bacterium]